MYNQKGFANIVLMIFMVAIVGGLIYFVVSKKTELVSNLKIYKNEKYGFEFEYPSTWKQCDSKTIQNLRVKSQDLDKILAICIYDPSTQDELIKSIAFYTDESGQYGTFGDLRKHLQVENKKALEIGLYSTFSEKIMEGRQYLHAGAGDVGTWGTYYTLLDAKTMQKIYLVAKYSNASAEFESILSSLKTKEDNLNF